METCALCKTTINEGAVACTGCGAVKGQHMSKEEVVFWKICIFGPIISMYIMASVNIQMMYYYMSIAAVITISLIAIVGFLYRYATRKEYWSKSI